VDHVFSVCPNVVSFDLGINDKALNINDEPLADMGTRLNSDGRLALPND
jgi:hypothetical protein